MTELPWHIYLWSVGKNKWVPIVGYNNKVLCFSSNEEARKYASDYHGGNIVLRVAQSKGEEE